MKLLTCNIENRLKNCNCSKRYNLNITVCIPRSSIETSFEVIDLRTGATIGPRAATPAPEIIKYCYL